MFALWTLPIGLICGFGQYLLTKHIAKNITKGKQRKSISVLLVFAKILLTFGLLIGLAYISVIHMLWAAGGILVTAIGAAIFDFVKVRSSKVR